MCKKGRGQAAWTRLITGTDQGTKGEAGPDGKLLASAAVRRRGGETKACSRKEGGHNWGVVGTHSKKKKKDGDGGLWIAVGH